MCTRQSAAELLLDVVNARRSGEPLVLLNLSEQSFRSFFNQYTDLHRRLFVALVLDQILLAHPNPFFLLYSGSPSEEVDFAADEVFQSFAAIWLYQHGHRSFCFASSATVPENEFPHLLGAVHLAVTADDALIRGLVNSVCPFIALMGTTKFYTRMDALRPLLDSSSRHRGRAVSEIHAVASEAGSALSIGYPEQQLSESSAKQAPSGSGRRARLARYLSFLRSSSGPSLSTAEGPVQRELPNLVKIEPLEYDIHDPDLERSLLSVTQAHFQNLASHPDRLGSDLAAITFDGDPSFVPDMLERDSLHDEDYVVFRGFGDPDSLILDIGANWGYSVSSIEASGAKSRIASFEAIPMYRPCLAAVAELRPKKYDYFMTALSDAPAELLFTVPVVNNQALSALTTAADHPNLESIVTNVVNHIRHWMTDLQTFQYGLVSFRVPVQRLDDVISSHPETFAGRDVVAIKIDVEGMEYPVLRGAEQLISQHHPLIMAEGGVSNQPLIQYLESLGYQMAELSGSALKLADPTTAIGINGFFLHRDKLDQYQSLGILA